MVTVNDIIKAINERLAEKYPEHTVYINLLPKDFQRPSFLIEQLDAVRTDVNRTTVAWLVEMSITGFVSVDGHYNSDVEGLTETQSSIMEIFTCGYLSVRDRSIPVPLVKGGNDFTECYVNLTFDYFDDRPEATEELPLIETIQTNFKLEE